MIGFPSYYHLPHHKRHELGYLFTASTLRTFAFAYMSLFIPVLVFQSFLRLGEWYAFLITTIMYVFMILLQVVMIPLPTLIARMHGLKVNFIIAQFALIGYFIFIAREMYVIGFILGAISTLFWWYSYHCFFAEEGTKKKFGRQVGIIELISLISGSIGPMIGGLLLQYTDSFMFFAVGVGIIAMSIISILLMKEPSQGEYVSYTGIIHNVRTKKRDFIAFFGAGAEEIIHIVIWPIFMFYIFQSYIGVGIAYSLIMLVVVVLNYAVGAIIDSIPKKETIEKIGTIGIFISWLGKIAIPSPLGVSIFEGLHKIFYSFYRVPLVVISYFHASHNISEYMAFREFSYKCGNIVSLGLVVIMLLLNAPIWSLLFLPAVFSLFPSVIRFRV